MRPHTVGSTSLLRRGGERKEKGVQWSRVDVNETWAAEGEMGEGEGDHTKKEAIDSMGMKGERRGGKGGKG